VSVHLPDNAHVDHAATSGLTLPLDPIAAVVQHIVIGAFFVERANVNLGDKARDKITGFAGIVVAITDWLNGCRRVTIQPQELRDGKPIDTYTFDAEQIESVIEQAAQESSKTGGPCAEPCRVRDPSR